jgi:hypothetical protein
MAMHQIEDEESRILSARMTVAALLETLDFDYGRLERLLGDFGGVALQTPSLLEVSRLLLRLQVTRALERDPRCVYTNGAQARVAVCLAGEEAEEARSAQLIATVPWAAGDAEQGAAGSAERRG